MEFFNDVFTELGSWKWSIIRTFIVIASVFLVVRQFRLQRVSLMASTLDSLNNRWESQNMMQARRETCENFGDGHCHLNRPEEAVCTFFEEIGLYVKKGVISSDAVWELYSYSIENYWRLLEPSVKSLRVDYNDKSYYERFEKLNTRMKRYGQFYSWKKFRCYHQAIDLKAFCEGERQSYDYYTNYYASMEVKDATGSMS